MADFKSTKETIQKYIPTFPPMYFFYALNNGNQNLIRQGSPPTTMSWYKKTTWPNLQLRTTETSTNQEPVTFTPINKRLWKFTFKLEIISKRIRLTFTALIFTRLLSPKIIISSTNCKWEIHRSFDWLTL